MTKYKGNPAAEGEAAARADNRRALEELNQEEAAELAETIEHERAVAIKGYCVEDHELADEMTDLTDDELLTLHNLTHAALVAMMDDERPLPEAMERLHELLSVYRRLELRIEYKQQHEVN